MGLLSRIEALNLEKNKLLESALTDIEPEPDEMPADDVDTVSEPNEMPADDDVSTVSETSEIPSDDVDTVQEPVEMPKDNIAAELEQSELSSDDVDTESEPNEMSEDNDVDTVPEQNELPADDISAEPETSEMPTDDISAEPETSEMPADDDGIDFFAWAEEYGHLKCGIFAREDSFFYLKKSFGFDLDTISSSISTETFWEGLYKTVEDGILFFTGEKLSPLFQLFSENLKDEIDSIAIIPFSDGNSDFFFLEINCTEESIKENLDNLKEDLKKTVNSKDFSMLPKESDIQKGFEISKANLFIISSKLSLEKYFNNLNEKLKKLLIQTATEEIYSRVRKLFQEPNCSFIGTNCEIKFVLFAAEDVDAELIQFHLNNSLKDFFPAADKPQAISNLLLLPAGICPSAAGAVDFLIHG